MKNFGPQPERSGEKSEKREKADLPDDKIDDVPKSVLEAKDVELEEVEDEEWPKEYEITVEIDGEQVEIPVKETKVKFPEYIVDDTGGVTGYIRKEIKWENFDEALPDSEYAESSEYFNTLEELKRKVALYTHPSNIERGGLEDKLELHRFPESKERYEEWKRKKRAGEITEGDKKRYQNQKKQAQKFRAQKKQVEEKLRSALFRPGSVLDKLTGENFLRGTANHVKNVYSSMDATKEQFAKERLYLQKLFDPETFIDHLKNDEKIYMHGNSMTIRSADSHKRLSEMGSANKPEPLTDFPDRFGSPDKELIREIENKQSAINGLEEIKKNPQFYLESDETIRESGFTSRGLSVEERGGYWWNKGPGTVSAMPELHDVIFGFGPHNKAFVAYLNKVKELKGQISSQYEEENFTNKDIEHLLTPEVEAYGEPFEDYHPHIPVYNSHPDIPDLRWCHASYGYIPTEKSFNVLEFTSKDIDNKNEN